MIRVEHLVKRYGAKTAVDDVSFRVDKGEVVGFLGPNGAGKSTTLRILSGFLGMTSGKVTVCGHDIVDASFEARRSIGYMPEAVPLYTEMRVAEYLAFRAELKRIARAKRRAAVDDAMEKARVTDVATTSIGSLSKGYRQRVGLADALVGSPPLLILDEPTAGLDPNQIREVRSVVKALGADHTVLLSTHILSEVEASCSRVILIAAGKLRAEGATSEIRGMQRSAAALVTVRGDPSLATKAVRGVDGITKVKEEERSGDVVTLRATWAKKLGHAEIAGATEKLAAAVIAAGLSLRELRAAGGSLEEVFAALTRDAAGSTADADDERAHGEGAAS